MKKSKERRLAAVAATALLSLCGAAHGDTDPASRLRIVGGLAGVSQYMRHEEPFWTREFARLSGGKMTAKSCPSTAPASAARKCCA